MASSIRRRRGSGGGGPDEDYQDDDSVPDTPSPKRSRTRDRVQGTQKKKVILKKSEQRVAKDLPVEIMSDASHPSQETSQPPTTEDELHGCEESSVMKTVRVRKAQLQDKGHSAAAQAIPRQPAAIPIEPAEQHVPPQVDEAPEDIGNFSKAKILKMRGELQETTNLAQKTATACAALVDELNVIDSALSKLQQMEPTESKEMKRLADEVASLTNRIKDQPLGYHRFRVTDDRISILWASITHHINVISSKVALWTARCPSASIATDVKFPAIMGQILTSASNFALCAALLMNWLWRCVVVSILRSLEGPWKAAAGQTFVAHYHSLLATLERGEITPEFVSQVKCAGACGIEATQIAQRQQQQPPADYAESAEQDRLKSKRCQMLRDLGLLCLLAPYERVEIGCDLATVVSKAIELEKILLISKSIFRIGSMKAFDVPKPEPGVSQREDSEGVVVPRERYIVTSPWLEKQGTADGENFDQRTILEDQTVFRF